MALVIAVILYVCPVAPGVCAAVPEIVPGGDGHGAGIINATERSTILFRAASCVTVATCTTQKNAIGIIYVAAAGPVVSFGTVTTQCTT